MESADDDQKLELDGHLVQADADAGCAAAASTGVRLQADMNETLQGWPGEVGADRDMDSEDNEWARIEQEQLRHAAQLENFVGTDGTMIGPAPPLLPSQVWYYQTGAGSPPVDIDQVNDNNYTVLGHRLFRTIIELKHDSVGWIRFRNLELPGLNRSASPVFYAYSSSIFQQAYILPFLYTCAHVPCPSSVALTSPSRGSITDTTPSLANFMTTGLLTEGEERLISFFCRRKRPRKSSERARSCGD